MARDSLAAGGWSASRHRLAADVGCHRLEWSAWYRLFEQPGRFEEEVAATHLLVESLQHVPASVWYVTGIDSRQVPRDSQQMEGSSWLRCPRNPACRISIHRGQRFLNGSWLRLLVQGFSRAIPLRWLPAFPEKAVTKAHTPITEQVVGIGFLQWVRQQLDQAGRQQQRLLGLGDKQCWNSRAAVSSVQWSAWVYGSLMLTGYRVYGLPTPPQSPAAWYRHPKRWTLTSVVQACRTELWEQPDFLPLFAPSADNWQKIEAFLQRRPWSTPAPP